MRLPIFTLVAVAGISASAYPVIGSVATCHSGPGTSFAITKTYIQNEDVSIVCQTEGANVEGSCIWDKTSDGCYVSDYHVKTGSTGYIMAKCESGSCAAPNSNQATVDLIAEFEGFVPTVCKWPPNILFLNGS